MTYDENLTIENMHKAHVVIKRIANIAHHGGLIGFDDMGKAMTEIRRLSLHWWDKEEVNKLQLNSKSEKTN